MTATDQFMEKAREVAAAVECMPSEGNIAIIATALQAQDQEARKSERVEQGRYWRGWCAKRQEIIRSSWERDARAALAGDMRALRNRIDLIDAGPLDAILSERTD